MAIMIPSNPSFEPRSYEHLIFNALKNLPSDWFVLHSLTILDPDLKQNKKETEIDFVVLVPDVGCIVIEAKAGEAKFTSETTYFEGEKIEPFTWVYETGRPMKGNGPFRQARDNMYALMEYLKKSPYSNLTKKQTFYSCIWLHQISRKKIQLYPDRPECPKDYILSEEDLKTPFESLMRVIESQNSIINSKGKEPWNYDVASLVVSNVLAPTMKLLPGLNWEYEFKNAELNRMLEEQEKLLEFLSEQKIAVISGAAGTGKTMIALKKAQLEADKGNKVLFLCYNSALASYLSINYKRKNIDFFNISQWACKMCNSQTPDYGMLQIIIEDQITKETFPYRVVIVDEAQDFGQDLIDNSENDILTTLFDGMILLDGLLYLFYDKNQVVNSNKLPKYIVNADCKITLYRNCRNTKKIADASLKVLKQKPKLGPNVIEGDVPTIVFSDVKTQTKDLKKCLIDLRKKYKSIVVLTAKSQSTTSFYDYVRGQNIQIENNKYDFYTCRQFKGLEAEAVVLVDVDKTTFIDEKNRLLYYVGTSRAKFELIILTTMSFDDCEEVCKSLLDKAFIEDFDYKEQLSMALALSGKQ